MEEKNIYLQALDAEQAGDWKHAHELVGDMVTLEAAWVHAYLHRVEGDECNAEYWYNRAARSIFVGSLSSEWDILYTELAHIERN